MQELARELLIGAGVAALVVGPDGDIVGTTDGLDHLFLGTEAPPVGAKCVAWLDQVLGSAGNQEALTLLVTGRRAVDTAERHLLIVPSRPRQHLEAWSQPIADGTWQGGRLIFFRNVSNRLEKRDMYARLLDSLPLDIVLMTVDGRFLYVNPAAVADEELRRWMIGRSEPEYCQRRGRSAEILSLREQHFARACSGRPSGFEEKTIGAHGRESSTLRLYYPVIDSEGEVQRVLGYGLDISQQRRTENRLRQAQKMEALGRMAGGLAHDFNNLLTAIGGYCELLPDHIESETGRGYVREIEATAERAARMTARLLDLGRPRHGTLSRVSINQLIRSLETLADRLLGADIELYLELDAQAGDVRVDAGSMEQAVINLVVNARDAMPDGGRLTISSTRLAATDGSTLEPAVPCGHGWVQVAITDTGTGIDARLLPHVFEPFITTKSSTKGTGLGLATVYSTVHQANGHIELHSAVGQGTTARICLPPADAVVELTDRPAVVPFPRQPRKARIATTGVPAARPSAPGAANADNERWILLAEDEPVVRELVREQLEMQGFRVLSADSGQPALRLAREHAGHISLLVSDVMMPGMNGPELAATLTREQDVPVLFISGYTQGALAQHGLSGQHEVLRKPFTSRVLVEKVRSLVT